MNALLFCLFAIVLKRNRCSKKKKIKRRCKRRLGNVEELQIRHRNPLTRLSIGGVNINLSSSWLSTRRPQTVHHFHLTRTHAHGSDSKKSFFFFLLYFLPRTHTDRPTKPITIRWERLRPQRANTWDCKTTWNPHTEQWAQHCHLLDPPTDWLTDWRFWLRLDCAAKFDFTWVRFLCTYLFIYFLKQ